METQIHKSETYQINLNGGLQLLLTRSENSESLEIAVEWANGEVMESFNEWNVSPKDLQGIADLFADMAKAVNS